MILVLLAPVALAAAALLLWPLFRRRAAPREAGRAVYRGQLAELERDRADGLVGPEAAAAARREIERRILAEDDRPPEPSGDTTAVRTVGAAASLLVVVLAGAIYAATGSPGLPGQPLAGRTDEAPGRDDDGMASLVARAEARVAGDAFDIDGWMLLANTYAFSRRYGAASRAMAEALALDGGDARNWARYGEYIVLSRDGLVTPAARLAFARARRVDPDQPVARYYEGVAHAQDGDLTGALGVWRPLLAESPADAPWLGPLRRRIADAEALAGSADVAGGAALAGPTEEDIAAAAGMSPEERHETILGMVEGLAARLEGDPDNLEGWARLAHAYGVLGEWPKSRDAYDRALSLAPGDAALWEGFAEAVAGSVWDLAAVPDAAVADMGRVLAALPRNRRALYLTGLAAARAGDYDLARERWGALRALFPEGSPEFDRADRLIESLR